MTIGDFGRALYATLFKRGWSRSFIISAYIRVRIISRVRPKLVAPHKRAALILTEIRSPFHRNNREADDRDSHDDNRGEDRETQIRRDLAQQSRRVESFFSELFVGLACKKVRTIRRRLNNSPAKIANAVSNPFTAFTLKLKCR